MDPLRKACATCSIDGHVRVDVYVVMRVVVLRSTFCAHRLTSCFKKLKLAMGSEFVHALQDSLLRSLWQAVPFGLAHQSFEPIGELHAKASHIEIVVDVLHSHVQAFCKLCRGLLPRHFRPGPLLPPAKARNCSLMKKDICNVRWLRVRPLLRIRPRPRLETVLAASGLVKGSMGGAVGPLQLK